LKSIDSNITGHLPSISLRYINGENRLTNFFNRNNTLKNYYDQIKEKKNNYNNDYRKLLFDLLNNNYEKVSKNIIQLKSIKLLKDNNTFSVTTGHQINLFTGPLYFIYKIIDTIKICNELKSKYPEYNFLPIYWMASEDHDFKEINFFKTNNKRFDWNISTTGKVGELKTQSLKTLFSEMKDFFREENINSKKLLQLFKDAYLNNKKLSDATFSLVHSLFGKYGLLILNPDDIKLKNIICDDIIKEIINQDCYKNVKETNSKLNDIDISPQVNPRKINLFYIKNNLRSRIEKNNSQYNIVGTNKSFSEIQIINEIKNFPERFSPNVLFRPLYQEKILPNLAYVGGGSEIAYWLQLKSFFKTKNIPFPILKVRDSVLIVSKKQISKCKKLNIDISDLFKSDNELNKFYLTKISEINLDLTNLKKSINQNFIKLYKLSVKTDKSFIGALKAQESKQIKGLNNLEKRLLKAQKQKNNDKLNRLRLIKKELFPNNSLQEREINFSEFYQNHGDRLIDCLFENILPFNEKFLVISL
tara:strand:- start:5046 stop:6638 length:1593 start_codon:yes stop_codon:yes gene_type:complete